MGNSSSVREALADFQECVRALSDSVNSASVDWQDEVFASLQSSISQVAAASRAVMSAGTQVCSSLARVENILEEEWCLIANVDVSTLRKLKEAFSAYASRSGQTIAAMCRQAASALASCDTGINAVIRRTEELREQLRNEKAHAAVLGEQIEILEQKIRKLQDRMPVLQDGIVSLDNTIRALNDQLSMLHSQLNRVEDPDQKQRIQEQISRTESNLRRARMQREALENELAEARRQVTELQGERSQLLSRLNTLQAQIAADERELRRLEDKCERLKHAYQTAAADVAALQNAARKFSSDDTVAGDISCLDRCIACVDDYLNTSL